MELAQRQTSKEVKSASIWLADPDNDAEQPGTGTGRKVERPVQDHTGLAANYKSKNCSAGLKSESQE